MRPTELHAALRGMARAPLVPALVTVVAAVGLGAVLALWALVDALYLRPLPFPSADRIVAIYERHPARGRMAVVPANFLEWAPQVDAFAAVSGSQWIEVSVQVPEAGSGVRGSGFEVLGSGSGEAAAERLTGARVLPRFFEVWDLPPLLGRTLEPSDYDSGDAVAVVGEALWRHRLGADPRAIGATIRIDGVAHTLIGVMPAESSAVRRVEVWVPWRLTPEERTERRFHMLEAVGRLRPGRSAAEASAGLEAQYSRLAETYPDTTRDWRAHAVPLREDLVDVPVGAMALMAAGVLLTFGVACLNTGALLAAWWSSRRGELATRLALGASPSRLVRQLLAESALMAIVGVAGALLVARASLGLVSALAAPSAGAYDFDPRLNLRVVLAGAGFFVVFVAATALWPALRLVAASAGTMGDLRTTRSIGARASMAAQVAVSLVAATTAATLAQNVRALTGLTKEDARRHQVVEIVLPDARYRDDAAQLAFFSRLLAALQARPEIAAVGASSYVPPTQALGNLRFEIDGRPEPSDARSASPAAVDPRAFALLGVELVRGRLFDEGDGTGAPDVCVISTALARRYWGDQDPLGQRLRIVGLDRPVTIVGLVGDVRQPISADPRAETILYLPFTQVPWPFMSIIVAPSADPAGAVAAVRSELGRLDDGVAPAAARPLAEIQTEWLRSPRLHAIALTALGAAALLLTLGGIYARVAYRVALGWREWAVRQALGATPARLRVQLLTELAKITGAGVLAGLVVQAAASAFFTHGVFGADPLDWPRTLLVAGLVGVAAIGAGHSPGRGIGAEIAGALRKE